MALDSKALLQMARDGKISWEKVRDLISRQDNYVPHIVAGSMTTPPFPISSSGGQQADPTARYAVQSCAGTDTSWFVRHGTDPLRMLGERLRLDCRPHDPSMLPPTIFPVKSFTHIHAFSDAEKVRIFYVKDGVSNVIEEEANLFPSDGLVAQFKLLLG